MSQPLVSFNNNEAILKLDEYGYWSFTWSLEWAANVISRDFNQDLIKNYWLPLEKVLERPISAQLHLAYFKTAAYLYYIKFVLNLDKIFYPIIEIGLKVGIKECLENIPNFKLEEDDIRFALNTINTFENAINFDLEKLRENADSNFLIPNFDYASSRLIRLIERSYGFPEKDIPILISDTECMGLGILLNGNPIDLMTILKDKQACVLINQPA
jgi:hypothetical protein